MIHGATKCQEWETNPNRPCVEAQFFWLPDFRFHFIPEDSPKSNPPLTIFRFAPCPLHCLEVVLVQVWPTCPWRLGLVMRCNAGVSSMDSQDWSFCCSYALQIWLTSPVYLKAYFSIIFPILLQLCSLVLAYCKERTAVVAERCAKNSFSLCFGRFWLSSTIQRPKQCLWPPGQKSVRVLRGFLFVFTKIACSWVHGCFQK